MPTKSVLLATAGYDHVIRLWEASNGTCYHTLQFEGSQVNKLEISPNKQWIAAAGNPHVRLYDVNGSDQKGPVRTFEGHTNNVTAIGFQKVPPTMQISRRYYIHPQVNALTDHV